MSGPQLSDDGQFWWDGRRWQPMVQQSSGTSPWDITRAILAAVLILFVIGVIVAVVRSTSG